MKEQFHIVLITVGLFVAGLLAGVWTQRTRPIPAPVAPVLSEFGSVEPPGVSVRGFAPGPGGFGFGIARTSPEHGATIVQMNAKMAQLAPKIKEFQGALDAIEKDFLVELNKILSAEQRQKLASLRAAEAPVTVQIPPPPPIAMGGQSGGPAIPGGQNFVYGFQGPMVQASLPVGGWLMMSMIIYQPSLDHLISELKLDSTQQSTVRELMVSRRTKLLALIDKSPPPTLELGEALP
jgi:hypothetical protein